MKKTRLSTFFQPQVRKFRMSQKLDISLSIDNLFDERYRSFYLYEDPGTTYFAEIKFVF